MTTPAEELRTAATTLRTWAAESTDCWAPGAAAAFGPAVADMLDDHASTWDPDPDATQTWDARFDRALAVARLVNQEPS